MTYEGKWRLSLYTQNSVKNNMPPLMPHQTEAVQALKNYFDLSGNHTEPQTGMMVMPTGSGKTFAAVHWLLSEGVVHGYKILWFAHRQELVSQAEGTFCSAVSLLANSNIKYLRIFPVSGNHGSISQAAGNHVVVCSIQSAATPYGLRHIRGVLGTEGKRKLIVVIDEAHHATTNSYDDVLRKIKQYNPNYILLGLTATPRRMQGNDKLVKMFNMLENKNNHKGWKDSGFIYKVTLGNLIERGILSSPHYELISTHINGNTAYNLTDKDVKYFKQFGKLPEEIFNKIGHFAARNKIIVKQYLDNQSRYGKLLVFAVNKENARLLCEEFRAAGIACDYVISGKPETSETIQAFRDNKFNVLINVQILTEGCNVPDVQTVFLTRETNSDVLFMQIAGRALRGKTVGGTTDAFIVDFHDNWKKLEFWFDPYDLEILHGHNKLPRESHTCDEYEYAATETENNEPPISPEYIAEMYRKLTKGIAGNWTVSTDAPFWPVGWYEMPKTSVLVFSNQERGYELLKERCSLLIQEDFQPKNMVRAFWDAKNAPRQTHIQEILGYIRKNKKMPPYYSLGTVDEADPYTIGKYIKDTFPKFGDGGLSGAALEWLEKKFEQSKRIQSVYGNYQKFSVAVEMAVRLRRNADIIEEDERRKYHIILGYYNLQELIEEVYQAYPKLRKAEIISLEWSQRVLKSWFAYCQSIGRNRYKISVNRLMSSPEISRETIKYLLYHELLHANGLWSHDKEFRQAEWQYPDSDRWDSELDSLYEQYKLDFSALKKEFNEKKTHEKVFVFTGRRKGESKPSPVVVIGNETEPTTFEDEPATKKPDGIMEGFKYCRNCGRKLRTDANFCNKCGRPVKY